MFNWHCFCEDGKPITCAECGRELRCEIRIEPFGEPGEAHWLEVTPHESSEASERMEVIRREHDRIEAALREPQSPATSCRLYAAQQALAWAMKPAGFGTLYESIHRGRIQPDPDA